MKIELYAVKDTLVGFSTPFPCTSEQVALRQFAGSAQVDVPSCVNTYPEHKELWKIGEMDDQTGMIANDVKFIAKAMDFIKKEVIEDEESN